MSEANINQTPPLFSRGSTQKFFSLEIISRPTEKFLRSRNFSCLEIFLRENLRYENFPLTREVKIARRRKNFKKNLSKFSRKIRRRNLENQFFSGAVKIFTRATSAAVKKFRRRRRQRGGRRRALARNSSRLKFKTLKKLQK